MKLPKPHNSTFTNTKRIPDRKDGGFIHILIIAVIILAVVGALFIGYFYAKSTVKSIPNVVQTSSQSASTKPAAPASEPTTVIDETAGWETFKDGIVTFKHPKNYYVYETDPNFYLIVPNESTQPARGGAKTDISLDARLGIPDTASSTNKVFSEAVAEEKKNLTDIKISPFRDGAGVKITGTTDPYGMNGGWKPTTIILDYNGAAVRFGTSAESANDLKIFNQISDSLLLKQ